MFKVRQQVVVTDAENVTVLEAMQHQWNDECKARIALTVEQLRPSVFSAEWDDDRMIMATVTLLAEGLYMVTTFLVNKD